MPTLGRLVVAAVALVVLVGGLPPAAAGPVTEDSEGTGFDRSVYRDHAGDVVPMTLSVPAGSNATLSVDGPDYAVETTVADADADGRVRLSFDTYEAGWRPDERVAFTATGADRVVSTTRTSTRRTSPVPTGRYRFVLDTASETSGAVLLLSSPATHFARSSAVPADARPASIRDFRSLSRDDDVVAVGDWAVVAFRVDGLSGPARVDDPLTADLVRARNATPGAQSRHVVRYELDRAVENLSTLTVDYDAGDGGIPAGLHSVDAVRVGLDHDGDGRVERDLSPNTATTVPREGALRIALEDDPSVDAGETLVVDYRVRNPEVARPDAVALWLGERMVERGQVEYGLAARGALGNGVDVTLDALVGGERRQVPLPAHEFVLDRERDTLYVVLDTSGFADEPAVNYRPTFRISSANPYVDTPRSLSSRFTVVERRATFERLDDGNRAGNAGFTGGVQRVAVDTTLAPGTELTVRATAGGDPSYLAVYDATVDTNRTATVEVVVPDRLRGRTLSLVLEEDGEALASPIVGRVV